MVDLNAHFHRLDMQKTYSCILFVMAKHFQFFDVHFFLVYRKSIRIFRIFYFDYVETFTEKRISEFLF